MAEAIAVARPYAVDTASGTEAAPGRKDPARLRAFFDAVQPAVPVAGTREPGVSAGAISVRLPSTASGPTAASTSPRR